MTCLDENAVLAWLGGAADARTLAEIEAHVESCSDCRRLVSELAGTPEDVPSIPLGELGSVIDDRWHLVEEAGRGGMGKVYRARDLATNHIVALKRVELDDARFAREARVLADLAHPAIVGHIADGVAANGSRYLVMEWLEGETLARRLARGPLSVSETIALGLRVAEALGAAHTRGVVHRDVKPSNLFLPDRDPNNAKVLDFGLARTAERATVHTRTGALLGTPGYMAPEQARGDHDLTPAADVFGLGCVLYECLTGERAFPGANVVAVLSKLFTGKTPRPRARRPDVPRSLDELVTRMLAQDPARRPADGTAVAMELAALGSLRILFRRANVIRAAVVFSSIAAVAAGAAFFVAARRAPRTAPTARPVAHVITDATVPPGTPPEAANEYRAALAALRHAALEPSREHFEKAVTLDPTLAGAHLRMSLWNDSILTTAQSREHYRLARVNVGRLDARDRELLTAVETGFMSEPPDFGEVSRRLGELAARYPNDAELGLLAINGVAKKPADFDAVLAIDPQFAYAWWSRANAAMRQGDNAGAMASIDRCFEASAEATLCALLRVRIDAREGRCADMERDARRVIAVENGGTYGHLPLANALAAQFAERSAVEAVTRTRAAGIADPTMRARTEALELANIAASYGDFVDAERRARELADLVKTEAFEQEHVPWAVLLVDVLDERGDEAAAGRAAEDYLRRRPAWRQTGARPHDDPRPMFLAMGTRAGLRTPAAEARERDAWEAEWHAKLPKAEEEIWLQAWARPAQTPKRLEEAVAHMPPVTATHAIPTLLGGGVTPGFANAYGGRAQLAEHPAEALKTVSFVAHHCSALVDPITSTRSSLWEGQAYEALHDTAHACAAYAAVVARWGRARPRSITAERARARLAALSCP